jgi:hypothetical protein
MEAAGNECFIEGGMAFLKSLTSFLKPREATLIARTLRGALPFLEKQTALLIQGASIFQQHS